eukprot:8975047-Alexandrium_andersonii.AAC.1
MCIRDRSKQRRSRPGRPALHSRGRSAAGRAARCRRRKKRWGANACHGWPRATRVCQRPGLRR